MTLRPALAEMLKEGEGQLPKKPGWEDVSAFLVFSAGWLVNVLGVLTWIEDKLKKPLPVEMHWGVLLVFVAVSLYFLLYRITFRYLRHRFLRQGLRKGIDLLEQKVDSIQRNAQSEGKERGRLEALRNTPDLLEPIIDACGEFIDSMPNPFLQSLAESIVATFPGQPKAWREILDRACPKGGKSDLEVWAKLAGALSLGHIGGLDEVRTGKAVNKPILPSNYYIYAKCVGRIEQVIDELAQSGNCRISIYTLLTPPITKWFNIVHISQGKFFCTENWWEDYKRIVKKFTNQTDNKGVSIARLVGVRKGVWTPKDDEVVDPQQLVVWVGDHTSESKPVPASRISEYSANGVSLIEGITPSGRSKDYNNLLVHLIGKVEFGKEIPEGWRRIFDIFETDYHDGSALIIDVFKAGVYFHYFDHGKVQEDFDLMKNDDIFLVEVQDIKNTEIITRFGLTFTIEETKDITGITVLPPAEVEDAIKIFKQVWRTEGKPEIPQFA